MASSAGGNPTTLELTESEARLRDLLLDVAAFIDKTSNADEGYDGAQVPDELKKEKTVLRWTGGWVRDKLLGVGSHDIDVAINNMTGEHFGLKMLEYLKTPAVIKNYGFEEQEEKKLVSGLHTIKANPEASKNLETATIKIMGIDLDLVNLRKETYNEVSRNPQMEFGTAQEDAMRRDATVNAMFYNLNTGQIEDFTGRGFQDMEAKVIRTPLEPHQTFLDDPLRVLRLIRFASRLNYTIDPGTEGAMGHYTIQKALKEKIKRERVGIEIEKMLRGPDPARALGLIDKLNLYNTIFTSPRFGDAHQPNIECFKPAYEFAGAIRVEDAVISRTILRNPEEQYLAWLCAALLPWVDTPDVPHPSSSKKPLHAAYLVAQEGLKAPNRVCDVISAAIDNMSDIAKVVQDYITRCHTGLNPPIASARDTLGMAIRRWGSSWRTQVFWSMTQEVLEAVSKDQVIQKYHSFLYKLETEMLLDADKFKPLLNGKELARAMDLKPGPWMKDALNVVMAWQLRNPAISDPAEAIAELQKTRKSMLVPTLVSQLLSLTIRPLFTQNEHGNPPNKPWKEGGNKYVLSLLKWILTHSDEDTIKHNFYQLRQPILLMLEDEDLDWKAEGCELFRLLMEWGAQNFIISHKHDALFAHHLWPCFNYLPSLTPEDETMHLFIPLYGALKSLYKPKDAKCKEDIIERIVREGVIAPLQHFATPTTYPRLTTLIVSELNGLLDDLNIASVKHVEALFPLLGEMISNPFAPAHAPMLVTACKAMQSLVRNAWPRMKGERAWKLYLWIYKAWSHCSNSGNEELKVAKNELKGLMARVDALLRADSSADLWKLEKERVGKFWR